MSDPRPDNRRIVDLLWEPDEIELFLFSAACWLPHRIHYDQAFARLDGHPSVVVHGPLQIARMVELATAWARVGGGRIGDANFRHVNSAYVGDPLHISLDLLTATCTPFTGSATIKAAVEVAGPTGEARPATIGTLTVEGPEALLIGAA